MASPGGLSAYEGSDEASESELLDQSLSVWKGWSSVKNETFSPIPLDIYTASSIGQYDCVRAIVRRGDTDLNKPNKGGWTPLMYACYIGHDNIVNILLDANVNVNVKNKKGQRAMHLACSCGNESVVYFLMQAGADLEGRDRKGWTALFHATYSGHQNMVQFLLDNGADAEAREPRRGFSPFMEAAAAGHEIIIQYFLLHGVDVDAKALSGHTARSLALDHGHTKIVSMIDNHNLSPSVPLRSDAGLSLEGDLSSSDESGQRHRRQNHRGPKDRYKGPSIRDGPDAFNKMFEAKKRGAPSKQPQNQPQALNPVEPRGYLTFKSDSDAVMSSESNQIRLRDVTSPISPDDHPLDSSGSKVDAQEADEDSNAFTKTGALTIKSSSGSSGGLIAALGLSRENSIEETDERFTGNPGPLQRSQSDNILKDLADRQKEDFCGHQQVVPPVEHYYGPQNVDNMNAYSQFGGPQMYGFQQNIPELPVVGKPQIMDRNMGRLATSMSQHTAAANPLSLFSQTPELPQNHPISMLQHPLWQPYGYGTLPPPPANQNQENISSHRNSPVSQSPGPSQTSTSQDQKGRVGLSENAAAEQKQVFENRPQTLVSFLEQLGLNRYLATFDDQDVDLQVFLSLTDNDLKEVGINLFGPRRKMTNAIARWHSNVRPSGNDLEQAYADKLEADMQEMAIQLKLAKEEVAQLKLQVQQEQELRAVTETCLVNDRLTWQQVMALASDSQKTCHNIQDILNTIRQYHTELYKRMRTAPQACLTGSGPSHGLAAALKEGLLLEEKQPVPSEITNLATHQLFQHLDNMVGTLDGLIAMATRNTENLLDISPSSFHGYS